MAPELAIRDGDAEASSDVWSFGVLAHELLTRHLPFATPPVLDALARKALTPPKVERDAIPEALRDLVARCLALDPAARPTAAEIAAAL
jgi:serine/threonine-protein kinase